MHYIADCNMQCSSEIRPNLARIVPKHLALPSVGDSPWREPDSIFACGAGQTSTSVVRCLVGVITREPAIVVIDWEVESGRYEFDRRMEKPVQMSILLM
jgi:hypothetical protein